ncbi:MAG: hypothetical protein C4K58_04085 [Flavobacteriaceae bacterium]|nr:MAG: hypothetical protein C4K58_04085 [Flavobacteriaceae bacterium]
MIKFLPLILLVFSACSQPSNDEDLTTDPSNSKKDSAELVNAKSSQASWNILKERNGNSYKYTVQTFYFGPSPKISTTITVKDGVIVQRDVSKYNYNSSNQLVVSSTITEIGTNIGKNQEGAKALTIDQLYQTCISEILTVDKVKNTITFNTDSNKMIKDCYYTLKDVADYPNIGSEISEFTWIKNSVDSENITKAKSSLESWKDLKKNNGNSYMYTVHFRSWVGSGSKTTLTIQNGVVTKREYEEYKDRSGTIVSSYSETGNQVGKNQFGADALTIDQLYDTCISSILTVNPDHNYISFSTDNSKMMRTCSYFPKNCADDCSVGVNISDFVWLKD